MGTRVTLITHGPGPPTHTQKTIKIILAWYSEPSGEYIFTSQRLVFAPGLNKGRTDGLEWSLLD